MAQLTKFFSRFVFQFRWEWSATYAGTICFEDAINLPDTMRSNTQSRTSPRTNRVGRSYERIRTKIYIQHGTLSPFGQNGFFIIQQSVNLMFTIHQLELFQIFDSFQPLFLRYR